MIGKVEMKLSTTFQNKDQTQTHTQNASNNKQRIINNRTTPLKRTAERSLGS